MAKWNEWTPFKKSGWHVPSFGGPKVVYIRSLATINLFVLAIRLVQVFFAGCVLGIMAYYISLLNQQSAHVPYSFTFALVVPCFAILTQFIYCFRFNHKLYFIWDFCIGIGFLLSFFWFFDGVRGSLSCSWGAFNPFGTDRCAQTRSVFVMQIILTVLWMVTSIITVFADWRSKRKLVMGDKEIA